MVYYGDLLQNFVSPTINLDIFAFPSPTKKCEDNILYGLVSHPTGTMEMGHGPVELQ
jgi:hypothetical protein